MTPAGELVADLVAALPDVPIRAPGSSAGVLPCVAVRPDTDTFNRARYVEHGFVVSAIVSRDGTVAQLDHLAVLADRVLRALLAAGYSVGDRMPYAGGDAEEVHHLAREFPVTVTGPLIC